MPKIAKLIEKYDDVWVYLEDGKTGREFIKEVKDLGATFMDGSEIKLKNWGYHMGIGKDLKLGYVSAMCWGSGINNHSIKTPIINYRKFKDKKIDYMMKKPCFTDEEYKEISSNIFGDFLVPPVSQLVERYGEVWFYLEDKKAGKKFVKEIKNIGAVFEDGSKLNYNKHKPYMKINKDFKIGYVSTMEWISEYNNPLKNVPLIHYRKFKDMELDHIMKMPQCDDETLKDIWDNVMDE